MARTYVLLHGAHHGGWAWARVAELLRREGHHVFTPSATGCGDRRHLLNASIGLETYIQDVISLIEAEELSDITLVGHSISGRVISAVADRNPLPIRQLVYFDAGLPQPGKSVSSNPTYWAEKLKTAVDVDGVACFMPPSAEQLSIFHARDQAWVQRRLSPVPVKVFEDILELDNPIGNGLPATYIRCTRPIHGLATPSADYARSLGWPIIDLAAGHDAMITAHSLLTDLLLDLARSANPPLILASRQSRP